MVRQAPNRTLCRISLRMGMTALVAVLVGCGSLEEKTQTNAPDGFYVEASGAAESYTLRVVPPNSQGALKSRIQTYAGFTPQRVRVFDTPEGHYVQIDGRATVDNWSTDNFILILNQKPYFELMKSGSAVSETGEQVGASATVSLVLPTRQEADTVEALLRRRHSLQP